MRTFKEHTEHLQEGLAILRIVKPIAEFFGLTRMVLETVKILLKHPWLVAYIVDIFQVLMFFVAIITHPLLKPSIYAGIAIYGGFKLHKLLKSFDKGQMTEDQLKKALKKYRPKKKDIDRLRATLDAYDKKAKA